MMDKMYEQNLLYFKELSMYIQAGKQRLAQTRNGKLHDLEEKAKMTGLPEDAQAAKDLDSKCARFEKKLHDLELTRMISLQTAPQIRMIQNNDTTMIEKIQTTIVNTIPLWKSQMVLALGIAHSTEAAQAQRVVVIDGGEVIMDNVPKKIFSNVETMKNLGLDVPQVTELCWELKRAGYDISTEIIHEDECVQKLYEMLK